MKELPKIYHNTRKEFKNNKEVYLSYDNKPSKNNISDIKEKIIDSKKKQQHESEDDQENYLIFIFHFSHSAGSPYE